jgi:hypothetical protein
MCVTFLAEILPDLSGLTNSNFGKSFSGVLELYGFIYSIRTKMEQSASKNYDMVLFFTGFPSTCS